jgi:hypothetical protein
MFILAIINFLIISFAIKYLFIVSLAILTLLVVCLTKFIYSWLV